MELATHESLKVKIDNYSGPLEVLLDLAKSQKVDLANISITQLADQFIEFINTSKKINLERFIFAIGIRYIGETISTLLAQEFLNINSFIKNSKNYERLINIDGLGPKAIDSIIDYFSNKLNQKTVLNLIKILKISNFRKPKSSSFFNNKSFSRSFTIYFFTVTFISTKCSV